jgi:hypothetical protein
MMSAVWKPRKERELPRVLNPEQVCFSRSKTTLENGVAELSLGKDM